VAGLHEWFDSPPGQYLLAWEQALHDELVADVFGYHALQLGLPLLQGLRANRMAHRWLALDAAQAALPWGHQPDICTDAAALPFPEGSLDLVLLPHTLEWNAHPHTTLREVYRVLMPEGRVVISGLNPWSFWGLRQQRTRLYQKLGGHGPLYLPVETHFLAPGRLRDWLRLLGFDLDSVSFGCYRPALSTERWLQRYGWMDAPGARWWPIWGAAYIMVAVKRVRGMRLIEPTWRKRAQTAGQSVPVAKQDVGEYG